MSVSTDDDRRSLRVNEVQTLSNRTEQVTRTDSNITADPACGGETFSLKTSLENCGDISIISRIFTKR